MYKVTFKTIVYVPDLATCYHPGHYFTYSAELYDDLDKAFERFLALNEDVDNEDVLLTSLNHA